jgi:hypothetical protein
VAGINQVQNAIEKRYYPTKTTRLSNAGYAAFCGEFYGLEQTFIDRLNAVTWPSDVQAQATDVIAKEAALANVYHECSPPAGVATVMGAELSKAIDDQQAAVSAFRAVLGLPVAH